MPAASTRRPRGVHAASTRRPRGVHAASGKAAGPADTGVVSAGPATAADRRLRVVRHRQAVGRHALDRRPAAGRRAVAGVGL